MFKKGRSNAVGWLQRNASGKLAETLKEEERRHKKNQFRMQDYDVGTGDTYLKRRDLRFLAERHKFDLSRIINLEVQEGRRPFVLDSGAGFFKVTADLKRTFGRNIFVTALNMVSPKIPKSVLADLDRNIRNLSRQPLSFNRDAALSELEKHLADLKEAQANSRLADELKICRLEKFRTKMQYDVILDFCGPLHHSASTGKVLERYFRLLRSGGKVFLICGMEEIRRIENLIASDFDSIGRNASRAKCYLRMRLLPGTDVFEIKKEILQS
ncbi:MAG TPA: hypothetical protein HA222_02665 [Candidatus Diapherotrites archaeon]|uniref:Uncharacterized protein n=1 Tax=Candidatus Iainarchaeum sp. TaxID=3101447 RepID=A0A7J4JXY2_9ARCH|nr:hypothetical protein [Candidatus Diapherotrites archaeon]